MNRITTNVDQKLLRTTKFPPEFNQKVDTTKINIPVIKNWAAGEVSRILGYEDDVVINLLFDLLEGSKNPDVKSLQIQLTGFLEKDAAPFCKELWNLCLNAQKSDTGIPQQLVEAKKLELLQEKVEQERAIEAARQRRDDERHRERDLENIRNRDRDRRDRGGRGRGRGGGRGFDSRPPRDYSRSQSPPSRQPHGGGDFHRSRPLPRETDSYVPTGESNGRRGVRRPRSPSFTRGSPGTVSPRRRSPPRSRRTVRRNTSSERSRSRSEEPRYSKRSAEAQGGERRRREASPYSRRRSPPPKRRRDSSSSPRPRRHRSRTPSRSQLGHNSRMGNASVSPPRRRRSPSYSEDRQTKRANVVKDRHSANTRGSHRSRSRERSRNRSQDSRKRSTSLSKAHESKGLSSKRDHEIHGESSAGAAEEVGIDS
ncbi:hypothetical protein M436DRAFT_70039 [Aureobasidium namibiae CBS 147.97]|uniref:PWI domain-containing protein n=1 Tax=Aureobasidium namibiae CBS 147.97 TaxID=1043004 RepID=A0A074X0A8_9PEZI